MKKLFGLLLGIASLWLGVGFSFNSTPIQINASEDTTTQVEEKGLVVIEKTQHGTITTDIQEGNVGDICVVIVKHDLLYKIDFVKVNGVDLIESDEVSGKYSFALVKGENLITSHFIVDEQLCGELTTIVKQATNKDWENLFSVENVLILISWILEGGLFVAIIRYYIKDKKLEKKLENATKETLSTVVNEEVRKTILKSVEEIITPIFKQISITTEELKKIMGTFSKCFALMQENTPESKRAILDELSGLKISDENLLLQIKDYIEKIFEESKKNYEKTLSDLKEIENKNKNILNNQSQVNDTDDGTQI